MMILQILRYSVLFLKDLSTNQFRKEIYHFYVKIQGKITSLTVAG